MSQDKKPETMASKLFSWLPGKLAGKEQPQAADPPKPVTPEPKLVIFIVDWNRLDVISGVFEKENVVFHLISKARGTASSEVLNLLGIGASDKVLVICLEQTSKIPVLLKSVRQNLNSRGPGAGIAFTVPLSGINSPVLRIFKQPDNEKPAAPGHDRRQGGEFSHYLIMSVVNNGYSDELMDTARKAGASGGTVLNARCQTGDSMVKFFGISVQGERELIFILTGQDKKHSIMQAIGEAYGLSSKAQGVMFSLPVESVMNFSSMEYIHHEAGVDIE
ncbi:MAG: hypothetical protein FWC45_03750 [Treponema sp.]|nr:hypothetical protein [Treponema sp.]